MTNAELTIAESKARLRGDIAEADRLAALRWEWAMGMVVNSENAKAPKR